MLPLKLHPSATLLLRNPHALLQQTPADALATVSQLHGPSPDDGLFFLARHPHHQGTDDLLLAPFAHNDHILDVLGLAPRGGITIVPGTLAVAATRANDIAGIRLGQGRRVDVSRGTSTRTPAVALFATNAQAGGAFEPGEIDGFGERDVSARHHPHAEEQDHDDTGGGGDEGGEVEVLAEDAKDEDGEGEGVGMGD